MSDAFLQKARRLAAADYNKQVSDRGRITSEDTYVVWFSKTLANWKALVSTDVLPGLYWEVTYNGAKQETYVDLYSKVTNTVIPDSVNN